jgi:prephenate dehydrogenase
VKRAAVIGDEEISVSQAKITIVGLGYIGGSMGLALKEAVTADQVAIVGHDKDLLFARAARKKGAVDKVHWNLVAACEEADVLVLAIPLGAIRDTLQAVGPYLKEGCVVTDTATVKGPVLDWAREILPDTVHFVGGNPIINLTAGERPCSGLDAAQADLFRGALYCLTPAPDTDPAAVELVAGLVRQLGALPYFLDPAEHDGLIAAVEHLPAVLTAVLLEVTSRAPAWREMRRLAGVAYHDSTQLTAEDAVANREVCLVNRDNLVRWIEICQDELEVWKTALKAQDTDTLDVCFQQSIEARAGWLRAAQSGDWDTVAPTRPIEMPSSGSFFSQLLGFGGLRRKASQRKE